MKQKKRTIKFLRKAKQTTSNTTRKVHNAKSQQPERQKSFKKDDMDVDEPENYLTLKYEKENDDVSHDLEEIEIKDDKKMKKPSRSLQSELNELEVNDPEFFNYLKQHDASLLNFESDDDEENLVDLTDDERDEAEKVKQKQSKKKGKVLIPQKRTILSSSIVTECARKVLKGSVLETKKLLLMFRAACIPNSSQLVDDNEHPSNEEFIISDPEIYEKVMIHSIESLFKSFQLILTISVLNKETIAQLEENQKWNEVSRFVRSFFKSIMHTISGLAQSQRNQRVEVSKYLINALVNYIPFLAPLPRLSKQLLKVLLSIWSSSSFSEQLNQINDDDFQVKVQAFFRIRQMATILPGAAAEECYRSTYLFYAREAKVLTETNSANISFMTQCLVELYSLDYTIAYQLSFLYIRQLALHLRQCYLKKSSESLRQITSWQYVLCIRVWVRMICSMPKKDSALGALAFPLCQIILGVMANCSSIYFAPLKLQLIKYLQQIAAYCELFVPTAPKLLELLHHPELTSKSTPSTDVPPNFNFILKLPNNSITNVPIRDALITAILSLVRSDMEIYRYHVGLPEYCYMTIRKLHSFTKSCKNPKHRDMCKAVCSHLEHSSASVKLQRVQLNRPLSDITEFEPLLTIGTPSAAVRYSKLASSNGELEKNYIESNHEKKGKEQLVTKLSTFYSQKKLNGDESIVMDDVNEVEQPPPKLKKDKKVRNKKSESPKNLMKDNDLNNVELNEKEDEFEDLEDEVTEYSWIDDSDDEN